MRESQMVFLVEPVYLIWFNKTEHMNLSRISLCRGVGWSGRSVVPVSFLLFRFPPATET